MSIYNLLKHLPKAEPIKQSEIRFRHEIWNKKEIDKSDDLLFELFDGSKILSVSTIWLRPIITKSIWPIFWFLLIFGSYIYYYYLISISENGYFSLVFNDLTIALSLGAFGLLCLCVKYMKFKTEVSLDAGEITYLEEDEITGEKVEKVADGEKSNEILEKISHKYNRYFNNYTVYYEMTPARAAYLQKDVKYKSQESQYLEDINKGHHVSLIAPLMNTRYNVNDISIVKKDNYGWRTLLLVILLAPLVAYLPIAIVLGVAQIIGPTGYDILGPYVLGLFLFLAGAWAALLTFFFAKYIFQAIVFFLLGMPQTIDPFEYRIRIRSIRGKWTTLLTTKSDVIATQAYNIINHDIQKIGDAK